MITTGASVFLFVGGSAAYYCNSHWLDLLDGLKAYADVLLPDERKASPYKSGRWKYGVYFQQFPVYRADGRQLTTAEIFQLSWFFAGWMSAKGIEPVAKRNNPGGEGLPNVD